LCCARQEPGGRWPGRRERRDGAAVPLLALTMGALGGPVTETVLPVTGPALFDLRREAGE
jgi:hypothetical protein